MTGKREREGGRERLGEVEIVQHDDVVLLLLAVQVDVPAQLGEEQQLAGLKIREIRWLA